MKNSLILVLASFIILFSCKSKKEVALPETEITTELSADSLRNNVKEKLPQYDSYSLRARVSTETKNESQNFTLNLRTKRDSIIWASITGPLGVEAARVLITSDTVKVIDRLNRKYTQKPFKFLETFVPFSVDINLLADLLAGNVFMDNSDDRWESSHDERYHRLKSQSPYIESYYWVEPGNFLIHHSSMIDLVSNRGMTVEMKDFQIVQNNHIAFGRKFEFPENGLKIDFNLNRITFDEDLTFPFRVSDNYERVE
ncbi:MAG: DUF4292 domain-containing protein [Chitinophagaceae bacterium]|nr:MAG: DUF4292 domain-containing protein [Chitinophagaceae bacterium]